MAELAKKATRVLAAIACTCPNSILPALIEEHRFKSGFLDKLLEVGKFADLGRLKEINDEKLQIFKIICHFMGEEHYKQANEEASIASEIPETIRPALHQLLPLNNKDEYEYRGVKVRFKNLVEIGGSRGEKGFWAAHLCGKIFVPYKGLAGDIKREQEGIDGFTESLSGYREVNLADYPYLHAETMLTQRKLLRFI